MRDIKFACCGQIINATYGGLFVDEYQDCSAKQHEMIMALSHWIPVHIVGDPLQGIFSEINREQGTVNLPDDLTKNGFELVPELDKPHRWLKKGNNAVLGEAFRRLRANLLGGGPVTLDDYSEAMEIVKAKVADKYDPQNVYGRTLWRISNMESVLVVEPIGTRINLRVDFAKRFKKKYKIMEAIDSKDFYDLADTIDELTKTFNYSRLRKKILFQLFGKTEINKWFGEAQVRSRHEPHKAKSVLLKEIIKQFEDDCNIKDMNKFLSVLERGIGAKIFRDELFDGILKSLETAHVDKISVSEAMRNHRNNVRRAGRKCMGRFIGTTLLTKGLEFDVVAILDAHRINCPKHLYVAMTRACKRLIVFTEKDVLLG